MGKWDLKSLMTGLSYEDRLLISDQSQADGSQDRNVEVSELAAGFEREVSETSHGLSVGDAVRYNGTAYVEATADTTANAELLGVVSTVIDTDTFAYKSWGLITTSGLTAGDLYYLQDAGGLGASAGTVSVPIGVATSTTELWLLPIGQGGGGGSTSVAYDLVLGFVGQPASSDLDWLLVGRAVTISSADPGSAHARTNPAATWTADILKNGASVGSVEISTAGADTFTVASDISLSAGDRIELEAPASADGSISDIQVTLKATVD